MFTGPANAGEVAILRQGMTYKPLSINVKDLQFLESRQFQITEIARMFNIQPHLLGDLSKATFSNIEHQGMEFIKHTLLPWICRWEEEINMKLFQDDNTFIKFNLTGLERADIQSRTDAYRKMFEIGVMTRNEIRALEDLNPLDDVDSDKAHTPVNVQPAELMRESQETALEDVEEDNVAATPQMELNGHTEALESVRGACLDTIKNKFKVAMGNILERQQDDEQCRAKLVAFFDTNLTYVERTMEPYFITARNFGEEINPELSQNVHNALYDSVIGVVAEADFRVKIQQLID